MDTNKNKTQGEDSQHSQSRNSKFNEQESLSERENLKQDHDPDSDEGMDVTGPTEFAKPQADHMDDADLEKKWQDIETSYRRRYPNLKEDDISYREGEFDDMTQRIAEKTNRSRDQVREEIMEWKDRS